MPALLLEPDVDLDQAVRRHRPELLTFARRLLGDAHEAEDAVQSALARAVAAGGEEVLNPRAWLYKFVLREAQNLLKRRRVRSHLPAPVSPEASGTDARLLGRVLEEVRALDEPYRQIVMLRYLQHLPLEEVAEALDLPVGTVKSYQFRALQRVREKLGAELDGTP